ncbi:SET domain-containing protein [Lentinus brumalis]|uniref:SET domain-containing protein n=1 Tax=Lentinus brumalis TaxID=2498619 RepID=A0A371DP78_9APHY|nr:SET domain-containing protein [Polyporus brumalis]
MSVQFVAAPSSPAISTPPLHIRTDPYAGRKYHASTALPAGSDLLGDCSPYSYTIWKRFRNEVCADCWRYDRGRRSFLTRRDDEGFGGNHGSIAEEGRATRGTTTAGAGLWFCDERCQERWIAREGLDAVDLLRQLEGARQKKPKAKPSVHAGAELEEITQEVADRAWDTVRERERSPKELRKWRDVQLDDYETDMARYVLLALLRCHREQLQSRRDCTRHYGSPPGARSDPRDSCEQGSEWRMFSSLQTNELPLLRACPEILEHQTRIYQLLRGRFGASIELASPAEVDGRRSRSDGDRPDLGDVITVANVRRILGVDAGNSFGIWEVPLMEESECLGFAVYPVASLFNHHCSPNVRKEREGRGLRFLTTRCVAEGEELCISYGHVESMSWTERQTELLEGWYFKCRCSRCTAEEPEREGAERGCR